MRRHFARSTRVRLAFTSRQSHTRRIKVDLDAEQIDPPPRRLLLARLRLMTERHQYHLRQLKVSPRSRLLNAVTHDRSALRVENEIIDTDGRLVIDVHRRDMQARPPLSELGRRRASGLARTSPLIEPPQHTSITSGMCRVERAQAFSNRLHDHVRETHALGSVGSAAEAAALVGHIAALAHRRITPDL